MIRMSEAAYRGWTGVVDLHLVVDNISMLMKVPNVHPKTIHPQFVESRVEKCGTYRTGHCKWQNILNKQLRELMIHGREGG